MGDKIKDLNALVADVIPKSSLLIVEDAPYTDDEETKKIEVGIFANTLPVLRVVNNHIIIANEWNPTSNTETCSAGKIGFSSDGYIYVAVANNDIRRVALSVFT